MLALATEGHAFRAGENLSNEFYPSVHVAAILAEPAHAPAAKVRVPTDIAVCSQRLLPSKL